MRTNIEIDDALLQAAVEATGAATKKEVVHRGLEALVRLHQQSRIRDLRGKLPWEGDLDGQRADAG